MDTNGLVLDPTGIPISMETGERGYPAVGSGGSTFLVTWNDGRSGSGHNIYGARVTDEGTVLDPSGIPISVAPYHQLFPAIAFDGQNYVVAWEDGRTSGVFHDIYGSRVTSAGVVLDPTGILIAGAASAAATTTTTTTTSPAAASSSGASMSGPTRGRTAAIALARIRERTVPSAEFDSRAPDASASSCLSGQGPASDGLVGQKSAWWSVAAMNSATETRRTRRSP